MNNHVRLNHGCEDGDEDIEDREEAGLFDSNDDAASFDR